MNTVELRHVSKRFGKIRAVDDVSLTIPAGSIYGLIGRNGAGKTTTIRMIMNIHQKDAGEILFRGQPVDETFRDQVGYLPEERGLYGKMKVLEALLFFAEIKNASLDRARADALRYLARFGLSERAGDKIETLSKGNQQKVQFIAAILHDPQLVILDEPFSGLDPVNTTLLINMISELRQQGKAILFSTHVMDFAEKLCDRVALIDNGTLILEGTIAEIKAAHGASQVALVSSGELDFLENLPYVASVARQGDRINVTLAGPDSAQDLLQELVGRGVAVTRFDATPATLHDIFVSLAGHGDETLESLESVAAVEGEA